MVKRQKIKLPPDQISARRIGECNGSSFSWNCSNYASLRPVKIEGTVYWLCGRCVEKIMLGKKVFLKKYGKKAGKKRWKQATRL